MGTARAPRDGALGPRWRPEGRAGPGGGAGPPGADGRLSRSPSFTGLEPSLPRVLPRPSGSFLNPTSCQTFGNLPLCPPPTRSAPHLLEPSVSLPPPPEPVQTLELSPPPFPHPTQTFWNFPPTSSRAPTLASVAQPRRGAGQAPGPDPTRESLKAAPVRLCAASGRFRLVSGWGWGSRKCSPPTARLGAGPGGAGPGGWGGASRGSGKELGGFPWSRQHAGEGPEVWAGPRWHAGPHGDHTKCWARGKETGLFPRCWWHGNGVRPRCRRG